MREPDPGRLRRRGVWQEAMTIGWTVAVAAIAITAGIIASSIALIGLGLESAIEMAAAAIVIWQLGKPDRDNRAVLLIGVTFLAGATFLLVESIRELTTDAHSKASVPGLAVAAAALVIMPVLALGKRRTGQALGSRTLIADSTETALVGVAAAAALVGVELYSLLGWRWAVPAAGLAIAAVAGTEGIHIWRHRH